MPRLWDGREVDFDDPYRSPHLISEFAIHLHNEGTLYEAYRAFPPHLGHLRWG